MKHIIRPIDRWPHSDTDPRRSGSAFKTPWPKSLQMLLSEAELLGAKELVIQVVTTERDLRIDGSLRANSRVHHPGAIVSFDTPRGPLQFASDAHESRYKGDKAEWQMNVHGIALGLAALRAVDRYGITQAGQQYTGWLAIEAGAIALPAGMTREAAAAELGKLAGWKTPPDTADPFMVKLAYREAAKRHHPDRVGDRSGWDRLDAAVKVLGAL